MLVQAGKRGVYDRLEEGDLLTPLNRAPAAWDLILAADVLVYLGDLRPVFAGAARALKPGGLFAFTVERSADEGWALGPRGRFLHGEGYLREGAQAAGLAVAHLARAELRRERGDPVAGFVTVLERAV
jgi:predicted TPR repeat methyltransferase